MFYNNLIQDTIAMPHLGFLDMTQENNMAELLAKEFFSFFFDDRNKRLLIDSIKRNNLNGFSFLLLNRIN